MAALFRREFFDGFFELIEDGAHFFSAGFAGLMDFAHGAFANFVAFTLGPFLVGVVFAHVVEVMLFDGFGLFVGAGGVEVTHGFAEVEDAEERLIGSGTPSLGAFIAGTAAACLLFVIAASGVHALPHGFGFGAGFGLDGDGLFLFIVFGGFAFGAGFAFFFAVGAIGFCDFAIGAIGLGDFTVCGFGDGAKRAIYSFGAGFTGGAGLFALGAD